LQIFGKYKKDILTTKLHQLIGLHIKNTLDVQNVSFTILSLSQDKRYLGLVKINNSKFQSNQHFNSRVSKIIQVSRAICDSHEKFPSNKKTDLRDSIVLLA